MTQWPKQSEVDAFYGNPSGRGGAVRSEAWYTRNMILIHPPFAMRMGRIKITRIPIHHKCAEALAAALQEIKEAANGDLKTLEHWGVTEFGGTFNYRLMRGGTQLSMHAYGCAIDLDPLNNGLGDNTPRFLQFPKVVQAFKRQGAVWGGDWKGKQCDGMHFQFARVS